MKVLIFFLLVILAISCVNSHCMVPCGIYDDDQRFDKLLEDAKTIRKAIENINTISTQEKLAAKDYNQLTRWVNTKEEHADLIIDVVSKYFLTQKIAPVDVICDDTSCKTEDRIRYLYKVENCHRVMRAAMTTKQNVDVKNVDELEKLINDLSRYFNYKKATPAPPPAPEPVRKVKVHSHDHSHDHGHSH
eukprot:TRINITY_DN5278_c0_g1_i1.p1 TRINITY_DN5278_c0_g1~~TRINITY_DN5278_c0_g1_i1.p1  ORF type:complete len:190 (+),score=43.23 TRINITY_DN5278_c0_g1_i1:1-570(+)